MNFKKQNANWDLLKILSLQTDFAKLIVGLKKMALINRT